MEPMSGPTGTQRGDRARTGTDIAGVTRSAWETRPGRRGDDSRIAGVAGAIARRYALDPTLVRVAFVVWAIVGGGLLLYLLGWLLLPPDPVDPPRRDRAGGRGHGPGRRSGPPTLVVVATVIVAAATLLPASGRVVTLVALALAGVTLYLLHTSRADLGIPGSPAAEGAPWPAWSDRPVPPAGAWADDDGPVAWDPLGAAPRGWSLPVEPWPRAADGMPVRGPRPVLTPVTLALALVAAGLAGAALLLGLPGANPVWIPAAALAVVGLGLVVGSIAPQRPRRGLVVAAVPLIILTVLGSLAATQPNFRAPWSGPDSGIDRGAGDVTEAPMLLTAVAPQYRTGLGDIDLDLTRLAAAPGAPPVRTVVESGAGDITVKVPPTADVTVSCDAGLGDVDCLGVTSDVGGHVDLGPDGPGGIVLDVTARSGAGDVEVQRG
jgi:phage shock protein PspC (stress-responsive transcriptional regulator)